MKILPILLLLASCESLTDSQYEKAQKATSACQPYRVTIVQLEDKISMLEEKIAYLRDEIDTLESNQY